MKKQILTFLILLLPFIGYSQDFMIHQKPFASSPPLNRLILLDDGAGNYTSTTLQNVLDQVEIPDAEGDGYVSGLNWSSGTATLTVMQSGANQHSVVLSGLNYNLPTAQNNVKGGIKVGSTLSISNEILNYNLPAATAGTRGGFRVGSGLTMTGDVLSVTGGGGSYTLPTASESTKGGVRVFGNGLWMNGDFIQADFAVVASRDWVTANFSSGGSYTLPAATAGTRGGIRVGSGLSISGDVLSATATSYSLPAATPTVRGGIKVGNGLAVTSDVLRANISGTTNTIPMFTSQYGIGDSPYKIVSGQMTFETLNTNIGYRVLNTANSWSSRVGAAGLSFYNASGTYVGAFGLDDFGQNQTILSLEGATRVNGYLLMENEASEPAANAAGVIIYSYQGQLKIVRPDGTRSTL